MSAEHSPELARPLIGITTGPVTHNGLDKYATALPYAEAINLAGGAAVLLPFPNTLSTPESRKGYVSACRQMKGIVMAGGNDIQPSYSGKLYIPGITEESSPERDDWEIREMAKIIDELRLPFLGICRGMQAINVARGGTLRQHVVTDPDLTAKAKVIHQAPNGDRSHRHSATIVDRASRLGRAVLPYMGEALDVNSFHHQGVEDLGAGLKVVARSEDGLPEAIEDNDPKRFLMGVQWHPETMEEFKPLFQALVVAAGGRRLALAA